MLGKIILPTSVEEGFLALLASKFGLQQSVVPGE